MTDKTLVKRIPDPRCGDGVEKMVRNLVSHARGTGHELDHLIAAVALEWVATEGQSDD